MTPVGAVAGIRPQDVTLPGGQWRAVVDLVESRGHDHLLHLRLDPPGGIPFLAVIAGATPPMIGAEVFVGINHDSVHLFDGTDGTRLA